MLTFGCFVFGVWCLLQMIARVVTGHIDFMLIINVVVFLFCGYQVFDSARDSIRLWKQY